MAMKIEQPDAIVLTLPVAFFKDRGMNAEEFKQLFERHMRKDGCYWNFKLTNLPKHDVLYVYLVFDGHIQYRANLMCYERNKTKTFTDSVDKKVRTFPLSNWVLFTGPVVKPSEPIQMRGFQGFRYSAVIF